MKLNRKGLVGLAVAAGLAGGGSAAFAAVGANPPSTVTSVTHIQNDPDSGAGGNTWAIDQIDRTVTISVAVPNTAPSGSVAYTATVTDTGTFEAIQGVLTPNQVVPGQRIAHDVPGTLTGTASYTITAPGADNLTADNIVANLNDGGHVPSGPQSLSLWPIQAFSPSAGAVVTLTHFKYVYTTPAGESWTDQDTTGDGNLVQDGNITGLQAPPPVIIRLSHGHGTSTAPTRETVSFQQSGGPSWDMFTIIGPGAINGHQGWVQGQVGLNTGVYSGLLANHGYTSCYTPVTSRGSTVQVPGSHGGCVYFVSNH